LFQGFAGVAEVAGWSATTSAAVGHGPTTRTEVFPGNHGKLTCMNVNSIASAEDYWSPLSNRSEFSYALTRTVDGDLLLATLVRAAASDCF
jgi:hypothetical protein